MIEIKGVTWPLPNTKVIEAKDFWHWMCRGYGVSPINIQGVSREGDSWFKPVVFVINRNDLIGGGLGVKCFYFGPREGEQEYFRWSECNHRFEHKSGGNCYHIYTCTKCGARYDIDSGD